MKSIKSHEEHINNLLRQWNDLTQSKLKCQEIEEIERSVKKFMSEWQDLSKR